MSRICLRQPASLDQLTLEPCEPRRPGPGEVLMRVHASSLNFHDYAVVTGRIPASDGRVPMSDGAGEVLEVGPAVLTGSTQPALVPGDRVMSLFFPHWHDGGPTRAGRLGVPGDHIDGFASEHVTVPAFALTRQPKNYSHAQAATLPCAALTAWRALMVEGSVLAGEVVVVQGTGGVSLFALQFAKAAGATVIATSSSDEKLARLRELGADHLINYRTEPKWAKQVTEITDGEGADHIVEVGGAQTLVQSIHACKVGGHISMIGVLTGVQGPVSTATLMSKNIRLKGITVGSCRQQLDMVRAIESNGLLPVIDSHYPLARIADAFRHQESGRHFGKIVVDIQ
jgi:NADPH:quinone reductase-like Zn-dependent oxidoreductase